MMAQEGTASASTTYSKQYRAYFTPAEVERLSAKQRGKLSVSREERVRQQACGFIDAAGVRCGFPRRTIATAQKLYMRFHLFFPYKDFNYVEVALSCLYVSSKLHDTLKKPRDIILASYPVRFPHLIRKGTIDLAVAQANGLDSERLRVLSIERLVLESVAFMFSAEDGLGMVVKVGKKMGLNKDMCRNAWRLAVDSYRTPAPLSYPPHIIALGAIYTASLLLSESASLVIPPPIDGEKSPAWAISLLGQPGEWETEYAAEARHVGEVAHALIDLYHTLLSHPDKLSIHTPSPVSPKEPIPSAQPSFVHASPPTAFRLPEYWTTQRLTELKIKLRERQGDAPAVPGWMHEEDDRENWEKGAEGMGRNDATVRFLWDAEFADQP